MTIEEINARRAQIVAECETATGEALNALETELRSLNAQLETMRNEAERRSAMRSSVAAGAGAPIPAATPAPAAEQRGNTDNAALYRSAFLKNLAVCNGTRLFGDLTEEERSAYIHTTTNSGNVVPQPMLNRIIDLVESMAPMYDDATASGMTQGFGVPRRTGITQGDATGVTEGTANEDEINTFDLLTLDGIEIKKHIVITRKMKFKSIDAFEDWVVQELAARIAVAKEAVIRARLDGTAPAGGSIVANAGIASGNIQTAQSYDDATIRAMFGSIKGAGARVIYANTATIWNHLSGIEGADGKKLFVPNSMEDPTVSGRIYGATVKADDNLSDNVVYLVVKGAVLANDYDDLFIHTATEPKTVNEIITGYSLFDAGLQNPKSAAKYTFAP